MWSIYPYAIELFTECPSASQVILENEGKIGRYLTITKDNNRLGNVHVVQNAGYPIYCWKCRFDI